MSNHKHRRDFSSFLLFLFIIIMIGGLVYSYMIYKGIDGREIFNNFTETLFGGSTKYEITSNSESDSEVIEKIFMNGMDLDDYKNLYDKETNYLKKNSNYEKITYNFDKKMHYSELEELYINMNNSDIANVEVIGASVDGRDIYGIEIGKGDDVLFLDANIHAAEVSTTLVLTKFLADILNDYANNDKTIVDKLNNVKIVAIPCLNPDGYEVYNYGIESINNKNLWIYQNKSSINFTNIKSNANGVDLNRNFPTQNVGLYYKGNELISNTSLVKTTKSGK